MRRFATSSIFTSLQISLICGALGSVTFLVAVFTIVDTFVNTQRNVIILATSLMEKGIYDSSSTMLWIYFLSVGLIMGVFMYLYNRFLLKRWK